MKVIAHRGLVFGPDRSLENHPDCICNLLKQNIDCEIDVRYINNEWYLGHDNPDYQIDYDFLTQPGLWIHAKNLEALYVLGSDNRLNFFWHQDDDFTLTSKGYIWTYPGKSLTPNSVMVMPEWSDPEFKNLNFNCHAICTDYVGRLI